MDSVRQQELQRRIDALVNDELFASYHEAATKLKNNDLVLTYDEKTRALHVDTRVDFLKGLREAVKEDDSQVSFLPLLNHTAKEMSTRQCPKENIAYAFWLVALFVDGGQVCIAIWGKPSKNRGTLH